MIPECKQYRATLLADPTAATAAMRAHRQGCPTCAQFTRRLAAFETRLARAVRLPLTAAPETEQEAQLLRPPATASPPALARRPALQAPSWYAVAASVTAVAAVAWLALAVPRPSLAGDVVTHMAAEPDAWTRTTRAVSPAALDAVMQGAHSGLSAPTATSVSYASSCLFRGYRVPHLVVQDPSGPVTVMLLVHESARSAASFDEQGYRGVILPMPGHGAIAVLTRNQGLDAAAIERVALELRGAIRWAN
jgi:hypothetical protein